MKKNVSVKEIRNAAQYPTENRSKSQVFGIPLAFEGTR
jgi:hypothetical protein